MGSLLGFVKGEGPLVRVVRDHNRCHYYALAMIEQHVPRWRCIAKRLGLCGPYERYHSMLMYSADRGVYKLFYQWAKWDQSLG